MRGKREIHYTTIGRKRGATFLNKQPLAFKKVIAELASLKGIIFLQQEAEGQIEGIVVKDGESKGVTMLIGLTGGIASGKSLVAAELKRLGAYLIDADEIAREVVKPGLPAYQGIVKEFGEGVLNPDKTINRKALGEIVFANPELRKTLEQITHPRILDEIEIKTRAIQESDPKALIVVDAALLIEVGFYKKMDKVVVVYADEKTQLNRLIKRSGLAMDEAKKRIASQMPLPEKIKYADFVIENLEEKSKEEIKAAVKRLFEEIKGTG